MNHCVPDFDMADDDYSIPTSSSSIPRQQKAKDDIVELLWQNGQVVAHSQPQRSHHAHKSPPTNTMPEPPRLQPSPPPENTSQLYIAEDEMATWLHYPLEDLYTDLLYPTSAPTQPPPLPSPPPQQTFEATRALDARPPQPPPPSKPPVPPTRNFPHFSRFREKAPTPSTGATVVDSNRPEATPVTGASSAAATSVGEMSAAMSRAPPIRGGGGSGDTSHLTVSSSTSGCGTGSGSGSGTSGAATAVTTAVEGGERKQEVVEDRKRKGREADERTATTTTTTECHTEDVEHESAEGRKHSCGSAGKRSRAAEVHNLSERRRRDRINEKMRALQELIPRCNKSDKASMLDEAIEYLKSLQMQVQIMTMGCGMVPFLYPGMQQQYMPHMGMGMGIGMGMDMGMSRPMMPFPTAVRPPALPTTPAGSMVFSTTAAPQLAPRFPVPAFPMHPAPQPSLVGALSNQAESSIQTPALPQVANLADPYQQYVALQQMQVQMQNQSVSQPSSSKPSSSRPSTSMSEEDFDDSQCG